MMRNSHQVSRQLIMLPSELPDDDLATRREKSQAKPRELGPTAISYAPTSGPILTRATGFMDAYDYTLNPYSGCSFGCTYCYAAFFSPDVEKRDTWGQWVTVKQNAVSKLSNMRTSLDGKLIYMSSVTDPYQPIERELKLTKGLLEILAEPRHRPKLVIQTRSPDVTNDIELFQKIEANGGRVQVNMTVTTDDEDIRRTFEPSCPKNSVRLRAIANVQAAGIQSCITMTPLLLVSDPELFADELLETDVRRFIVQPFHFTRGKFVANTRDEAARLMADKLDCEIDYFVDAYMTDYRVTESIIRNRLAEEGLALGEGKEGFKPPF
ncbi:MAG: radical SAM protein [Chloroflexi bacterium]|nr:radical SAM protein [Chloroflexota bacterium]